MILACRQIGTVELAAIVALATLLTPRVSADNNAAERSLRPTVVSRKISGGTRSPEGGDAGSVLAALFGTWRLRGRNSYRALHHILSQPSPV